MKQVDIIIPVYRGIEETRKCLESVLAYTQQTDFELIVINDASPEPELVNLLEEIAEKEQITLIHNSENKGFVATVNIGMSLHKHRDVVLLNSDTVPVHDWLDRLRVCAYQAKNIATVTPFSNNATICSYPHFCEDNTLPKNLNAVDLDLLFKQANSGEMVEIPTAVGFCMYIRRDCIDKIGLFDVETFGKGYGEENDFCMRALKANLKNVLCANVFVYHAGNVSFGETHNTRKLEALEKLRKIHPDYEKRIHDHIVKDPAKIYRQRVMIASLLDIRKPFVLFITHNRGGGTERHVQELANTIQESAGVLVLRAASDGSGATQLEYGESFRLYFMLERDIEKLLSFLKIIDVQRIHFHHLIALHPVLFDLPARLDVPYDFTVHDYYTICPQINLVDCEGRYCGEPKKEEICNACLMLRPAPGTRSIAVWRKNNEAFLNGAARCFCPSIDTGSRISKYFPESKVKIVYHERIHLEPKIMSSHELEKMAKAKTLKIVVIGALSQMKGADLLEAVAIDAKKRNLAIEFILIGYAYRSLATAPRANLSVTGSYQEKELLSLIAVHDPHLFWFPALCPETYSYTLSTALQHNLPIVASDLGAFRERLDGRPLSWIVPWNLSVDALNNFFVELRNSYFTKTEFAVSTKKFLLDKTKYLAEPFSYSRDYLSISNTLITSRLDRLDEVAELLASHFESVAPFSSGIRRIFFRFLLKIRASSMMRWLVRRIPHVWQSKVKGWILKHV